VFGGHLEEGCIVKKGTDIEKIKNELMRYELIAES